MDLALLLEQPVQQGITTIQAGELQLGLFTSAMENFRATEVASTYIHLDWGIGFANKPLWQSGSKPQQILRSNDLYLALGLLQQMPAYVYLPMTSMFEHSAPLHQETSTPTIVLPVYLAYRTTSEHAPMLKLLLADNQHRAAEEKA